MAITVWGVDPSIDELNWSLLHYVSDRGNWSETVSDDGSALAPTPGGGTRATVIASGDCVAAGVLGRNTGSVTVTHDGNATSINRLDYVVFRISWAGTNTTGGTIVIVKGSTTSAVAPALTRTPGTTWEIPLALVTVVPGATTFSTAVIADVRPLRRKVQRYRSVPAANQSMFAGTTTPKELATQLVDDPGWPYRLRVYAQVKFGDLVGNGFGRIDINVDGGATEAESRAPDKNKGVVQTYYVGPVRSGPATVRLRMLPSQDMAGEPLVTNAAFSDFTVEVEPA